MSDRLPELLDQARAGLTIEEACEFTPLARDEIDRAQEAEKVWRSAAEKWEANCDKADAEVERLGAELDQYRGQSVEGLMANLKSMEDENETLFNFNELEGPRLIAKGREQAAKICKAAPGWNGNQLAAAIRAEAKERGDE